MTWRLDVIIICNNKAKHGAMDRSRKVFPLSIIDFLLPGFLFRKKQEDGV